MQCVVCVDVVRIYSRSEHNNVLDERGEGGHIILRCHISLDPFQISSTKKHCAPGLSYIYTYIIHTNQAHVLVAVTHTLK